MNGAPPMTTATSPYNVTTTTLRFIPFQCAVQIRETSQQPSTNTTAIRIDITITGPLIPTVFVESRSGNQRDRKAVAVSKTNFGATQLVVLQGQDATITVYATADFEPDARMCSAKR